MCVFCCCIFLRSIREVWVKVCCGFSLFTSILFVLGKNQIMHPLIESYQDFPNCSDIISLSNSNFNLYAWSIFVSTYPYLREILLSFAILFFPRRKKWGIIFKKIPSVYLNNINHFIFVNVPYFFYVHRLHFFTK